MLDLEKWQRNLGWGGEESPINPPSPIAQVEDGKSPLAKFPRIDWRGESLLIEDTRNDEMEIEKNDESEKKHESCPLGALNPPCYPTWGGGFHKKKVKIKLREHSIAPGFVPGRGCLCEKNENSALGMSNLRFMASEGGKSGRKY